MSVAFALFAVGASGILAILACTLLYAHGEREQTPNVTATCATCGRLFHADSDEYIHAVNNGALLTCGGCA